LSAERHFSIPGGDEVEAVKKSVTENQLKLLLSSIDSIRYGSVVLVIQDSKLVQIEKNEKIRFV
jgi:hypothetical protein